MSTAVPPPDLIERLSAALWGPLLMHNVERAARALRHLPGFGPEAAGVEVEAGRRYGPDPAHRFDLYRPRGHGGPLPLALYVHGGGFQFFDRRTHWAMATEIARRGLLVACVDYRLAPRHPYPAAVEDVAAAYAYIAEHAPSWGAVPGGVVLAGESAGANLVLGLAIARCWKRDEPHARRVWDADLHPSVLLPACGYLQVADPDRHGAERRLSAAIEARIRVVSRAYVPAHTPAQPAHAFANPLLTLEAADAPARPFPPTFALVGGDDPVLGDTVRLGPALERLGVDVEIAVYPGLGHTFHALPFTRAGRRAWSEQMAFVQRQLASP